MGTAPKNYGRDLAWYIALGFVVLGGIAGYVIWVAPAKSLSRKWSELGFYSLMLFVFISKFYWHYRHRLSLWISLAACLMIHLTIYIPILARIDQPLAIWYVLTMPLEAVLIMLILWWLWQMRPDNKVQL
jgi:hypothetical protein